MGTTQIQRKCPNLGAKFGPFSTFPRSCFVLEGSLNTSVRVESTKEPTIVTLVKISWGKQSA